MSILRLGVLSWIFLLACSAGATAIPPRLSDWALFQLDGQALGLGPQTHVYDLSTPLFSDYAAKLRVVRLPPGTQAVYAPEAVFDFPVGTVLAKTFAYPVSALSPLPTTIGFRVLAPELFLGADGGEVLLVETRILVRQPQGWLALPYVWMPGERDAVLALTGRSQDLVLHRGTERLSVKYQVPNANQCKSCHVQVDGFDKRVMPIGPRARFLNRPDPLAGGASNQLQRWAEQGILTALPGLATIPRAPDAFDPESGSLDERARAYLDINCSHCHRATGLASSTGLFLSSETTDLRQLGVCKAPVAAGNGGSDEGFDIEPGQPARSLLFRRLGSTDPSTMMPELGRSVADTQGVELIGRWIEGLPGSCR
jgi:uncharacterized repeat protein (TIGR03806 family)